MDSSGCSSYDKEGSEVLMNQEGPENDPKFEAFFSEFEVEVNRRDNIIDNYNVFIGSLRTAIMYKNRDIVEAAQKNKFLLQENKKLDDEVKFHKEREKYLASFIKKITGLKLEDLDEFITEEKYNNYLRKKKLRENKDKDVRT